MAQAVAAVEEPAVGLLGPALPLARARRAEEPLPPLGLEWPPIAAMGLPQPARIPP